MDEGHSQDPLSGGGRRRLLVYRLRGSTRWVGADGALEFPQVLRGADSGQLPARFSQPLLDTLAAQHVATGLESFNCAQVARPKGDIACLLGAQTLTIPVAVH